jgi:hypothetical protein
MATVTTKKSGFREITGLDSDNFTSAADPDHPGGTIWTAQNNNAACGIKWGPGDEQAHGGDPPLKTGSRVREWIGTDGKTRHCEIERVK